MSEAVDMLLKGYRNLSDDEQAAMNRVQVGETSALAEAVG